MNTFGNSFGDAPFGIEHGGDTTDAEARYGRPRDGWIDLSTGINPDAYPVGDWPAAWTHRLPDKALYRALNDAAAACFAIAPDRLIATPGTQAAIQGLSRLRARSRVAVVGPTYGEHERAWRAAGHDVVVVPTLDDATDADVIVVTNPNNPDGRRVDPEHVRAAARRIGAKGGWLVVDEAFADATPDISVVGHTEDDGLIVLRSFGKFFGLAGLRLGFVAGSPTVLVPLAAALGPWAVAGPAAGVGARALADRAWIAATRLKLREASTRLQSLLTRHGLTLVGATSYFCLVETDRAPDVFARLARTGILVRVFAAAPRWLRIGLPGDAVAWQRLEAALEQR